MNKIPTAEEFLDGMLGKGEYQSNTPYTLIEFTKLHVKQALLIASKEAFCSMEHPDESNDLEESNYIVNKDSILDSYPESNIL